VISTPDETFAKYPTLHSTILVLPFVSNETPDETNDLLISIKPTFEGRLLTALIAETKSMSRPCNIMTIFHTFELLKR